MLLFWAELRQLFRPGLQRSQTWPRNQYPQRRVAQISEIGPCGEQDESNSQCVRLPCTPQASDVSNRFPADEQPKQMMENIKKSRGGDFSKLLVLAALRQTQAGNVLKDFVGIHPTM